MAKYEIKDGVGIIPEGTTVIEENGFADCTGFSFSVIDVVTETERVEYLGCTDLTNIVIPDSVTRIGENAFYGCTGLTSIVIPHSVKEIGENAFDGCTSLKTINVPFRNAYHCKKRQPSKLHHLIVELPPEEK